VSSSRWCSICCSYHARLMRVSPRFLSASRTTRSGLCWSARSVARCDRVRLSRVGGVGLCSWVNSAARSSFCWRSLSGAGGNAGCGGGSNSCWAAATPRGVTEAVSSRESVVKVRARSMFCEMLRSACIVVGMNLVPSARSERSKAGDSMRSGGKMCTALNAMRCSNSNTGIEHNVCQAEPFGAARAR